jgi:hypothetical protein
MMKTTGQLVLTGINGKQYNIGQVTVVTAPDETPRPEEMLEALRKYLNNEMPDNVVVCSLDVLQPGYLTHVKDSRGRWVKLPVGEG